MSAEPAGGGARFGARAVLAGAAIVLVAVPFALLLLLVQDRWRPLRRLDASARDALYEFALEHDWFVTVMKAVSFAGSGAVYWPLFTALTVWLAVRRLPRLALFTAVTMLGSTLLNRAMKAAVDRARPVLPEPVARAEGLSFPSGHAQSAVVAFGVLLLIFLPVLHGARRRATLAGAACMVLLIGFSRVALGVHFVSDVLAGFVLGGAWLAATTAAFSAWRRERGRPPVEPERGLEPEAAPRLEA